MAASLPRQRSPSSSATSVDTQSSATALRGLRASAERRSRRPLCAVAVGKGGVVRRVSDDFTMPQNFIAVDREQSFLMPPSLLDWGGR